MREVLINGRSAVTLIYLFIYLDLSVGEQVPRGMGGSPAGEATA